MVRRISFTSFVLLLLLTCQLLHPVAPDMDHHHRHPPTVFISVLVRNKAASLPHFLSSLYGLTYPKSRLVLHLRSDHNEDDSLEILATWLEDIVPRHEYHDIVRDFQACPRKLDEGVTTTACRLEDEVGPVGWTEERFGHVMRLREAALNLARFAWADFFWALDADVLLSNPDILQDLVVKNMTVVAPLLTSTGLYSNFWAGMSETHYYKRTEEYKQILNRKKLGCFPVPMVHSSVLVDLRRAESDFLTYLPDNIPEYPGPVDDIIVFALSCSLRGIPLHVCNEKEYGMILVPLEDHQTLEEDFPNMQNTLVEITAKSGILRMEPALKRFLPALPLRTKLGLDEIYMINLERRPDRKKRMEYVFSILGIEYSTVVGVDGRTIGQQFLDQHGIHMLPGFSEPYHGRPLTLGEIGCFMSHYNIWQEMIAKGNDKVLIFEDDIRFEPFFVAKLENLLEELSDRQDIWDLVFLGRKLSAKADEPWVEGSSQLVHVDYTYWTLAYILSAAGARKLIAAEPLGKMVPVDEFLPIMYDRHPNVTWKSHFPTRNLAALSVAPLLVYPTHYTGEQGYISDTEGTQTISIPTTAHILSPVPVSVTRTPSCLEGGTNEACDHKDEL